MDIKGKIAWVYQDELKKLAPELMNKTNVEAWYDVLEEHFLEQGYILPDEEITLLTAQNRGHMTYLRYNVIILVVSNKIHKIGMVYKGINRTENDIDKLSSVANHFRATEEGKKAQVVLLEYIRKMRELGIKNVKQLLK